MILQFETVYLCAREVSAADEEVLTTLGLFLAKFVREGLEGENYSVEVYADGEQARSAAMESEYDIVVLDLNLPKLDGISILRQLRIRKPSVPSLS